MTPTRTYSSSSNAKDFNKNIKLGINSGSYDRSGNNNAKKDKQQRSKNGNSNNPNALDPDVTKAIDLIRSRSKSPVRRGAFFFEGSGGGAAAAAVAGAGAAGRGDCHAGSTTAAAADGAAERHEADADAAAAGTAAAAAAGELCTFIFPGGDCRVFLFYCSGYDDGGYGETFHHLQA